jgi:hypothetical protein
MLRVFTAVFFVCLFTSGASGQDAESSRRVVLEMMKAFTTQDPEAMSATLTDDIGWYSIIGDTLTIQAEGKDALLTGLRSYFESIPSAHSEVEEIFVSGKYVVVRERGYWHEDGLQRTQSSLAVYEIRDGLIARVWYFPPEE